MSISLINLHPSPADLQQLVQDGLKRSPRQLPAWLLYDAEGSRLFAEICRQPEYTLTQREIALLEDTATAIAAATGPGMVVEFGIGNARKVDPLLTALGSVVFAALDISLSALKEALSGLAVRHPNTTMVGICCDHTKLNKLPAHPAMERQRRIGFFPGSSLGNFTAEDAVAFLRNARQLLAGGPLLLGLDQPREQALMEAAYDDAAGFSGGGATTSSLSIRSADSETLRLPIGTSPTTGSAGAAFGEPGGVSSGSLTSVIAPTTNREQRQQKKEKKKGTVLLLAPRDFENF